MVSWSSDWSRWPLLDLTRLDFLLRALQLGVQEANLFGKLSVDLFLILEPRLPFIA